MVFRNLDRIVTRSVDKGLVVGKSSRDNDQPVCEIVIGGFRFMDGGSARRFCFLSAGPRSNGEKPAPNYF